jgi:diacylglycerol kinase family enzyme
MSSLVSPRSDLPVAGRAGKVAVIAHRRKTLGGGLDELRSTLAGAGVEDLIWYEVPKSRKAPKKARKALGLGADLIFVWGGDGMVQRCADTLAGSEAAVAILPAGTANLFAANLDIPSDLAEAVRIGLHGRRRKLDLGRLNGEHFAVMAGAGFDGKIGPPCS